jgi:hypothetical protein
LSELRTQIGGKFSRYNIGLFEIKLQLVKAGIIVDYPSGNSIVKTVKGVDLSFDPDLSSLNFYEVEKEYLKAIRRSSFHTVCNVFKNDKGYVGRSNGMEIGYAMLHSVPVLCLYTPSFQRSIVPDVHKLLNSRIDLFKILRVDHLSKRDLLDNLERIAECRVDYKLSVEEEITVMDYVREVLSEYQP